MQSCSLTVFNGLVVQSNLVTAFDVWSLTVYCMFICQVILMHLPKLQYSIFHSHSWVMIVPLHIGLYFGYTTTILNSEL